MYYSDEVKIREYKVTDKCITITNMRSNDTDIYFVYINLKNSSDFKHGLSKSVIDEELSLGHPLSSQILEELVVDKNTILAINATGFTKHIDCINDNLNDSCNHSSLIPTWGPIGTNSKLDYLPVFTYENINGKFEGWSRDSLYLDSKGKLKILSPTKENRDLLENKSLEYNWLVTYGPVLVKNGEISSEAIKYKNYPKEPLTTIGQKKNRNDEFLIIICDGRINNGINADNQLLKDSKGLNIYEIAQIYKDKGYDLAYNLDGGGSTTLYYDYEIINNPVDGMNRNNNFVGSTRKIFDCLYIER